MVDKDTALMLRFQSGDSTAFNQLVERNKQRIIAIAYRFFADEHEAEDIAQEIFIKIYNAKDSYKPIAKFSTWVYRITYNYCINVSRKKRILSFFTKDTAMYPPPSSDSSVDNGDLIKKVEEAIANLPANQRMAVLLKRYEELSYEEIGQSMGLSTSAVKSLLNRAKKKLKDTLLLQIKKK